MQKGVTVFDCNIIKLNKISDRKGNITPIENNKDIPFGIKRVFYIYDIPGGESRGAHAHKECHQFLVAASGSFEVSLNDGRVEKLNPKFKTVTVLPSCGPALVTTRVRKGLTSCCCRIFVRSLR